MIFDGLLWKKLAGNWFGAYRSVKVPAGADVEYASPDSEIDWCTVYTVKW